MISNHQKLHPASNKTDEKNGKKTIPLSQACFPDEILFSAYCKKYISTRLDHLIWIIQLNFICDPNFVLDCNEIYLSPEVLEDHTSWSPSQAYNLYRGLLCE